MPNQKKKLVFLCGSSCMDFPYHVMKYFKFYHVRPKRVKTHMCQCCLARCRDACGCKLHQPRLMKIEDVDPCLLNPFDIIIFSMIRTLIFKGRFLVTQSKGCFCNTPTFNLVYIYMYINTYIKTNLTSNIILQLFEDDSL